MQESIRASFVARFGEREARRVERAARSHIQENWTLHEDEEIGTDEFRYYFLACILYHCLTRHRAWWHHFKPSTAELRAWAWSVDLCDHDGDWPDYAHLRPNTYEAWVRPAEQ